MTVACLGITVKFTDSYDPVSDTVGLSETLHPTQPGPLSQFTFPLTQPGNTSNSLVMMASTPAAERDTVFLLR
eukprot:2485058-Rhodomonas_salina.1